MNGWETFPRWYGWKDERTPQLVAYVWCPLQLLEFNRYGFRVLPEPWQLGGHSREAQLL